MANFSLSSLASPYSKIINTYSTIPFITALCPTVFLVPSNPPSILLDLRWVVSKGSEQIALQIPELVLR